MNKPPIGPEPSWFTHPQRIRDLGHAILRYTEHEQMFKDKGVTQLIREWAIEIICECDTIDKLIDVKECAE